MSDYNEAMGSYDEAMGDYDESTTYSLSAETAVIGSLFVDNNTFGLVSSILKPEDFYHSKLKLIFEVISELALADKPFDVVTFSEYVKARGQENAVGGLSYAGGIILDTPSASNVKAYADIVANKSGLRKIIAIGNSAVSKANTSDGKNVSDLKNSLELALSGVMAVDETTSRTQHIKAVMLDTIEQLDERFNSDSSISGEPTGFKELDKITNGLSGGDLIVIAARPSMGKTALGMNIMENFVLKNPTVPAICFSLEMPKTSLALRSIASLGKVSMNNLMTGDVKEGEWERITLALNNIVGTQLFLNDDSSATVQDIKDRALKVQTETGKKVGLILVDYLQLMESSSFGNENNKVSEISRGLKKLAIELDVPVIALSQLNRSLENRPNKRPIMSDIRASGAIEQDADIIIFIYRDEVYDENSNDKGVAEVIVSKNRNGSRGVVRLSFQGEYCKFNDLTLDAQDYS